LHLTFGAFEEVGFVNGRAEDRHQPQTFLASVGHVMARTRRHDKSIPCLYFATHIAHIQMTSACSYENEMFLRFVGFFTDLRAFLQRHHNQLQVFARVQNTAKCFVFENRLLKRSYKSQHIKVSFW
jgi:hypothetical protein